MEKNIKVYLHLYLDCECILSNPEVDSERKILNSIHLVHGGDLNVGVAHYNGECYDYEGHYSFEDVKPILRPLSDMSEDEKKELWKLVFKRDFNANGNIRFFDSLAKESKRNDISRWVMMSGVERLGIQFDCRIWADSDLQHWNYNQHETTRFLLSKHFDLFGLIEAGLAIDKTTLKPKQ